MKHFSVTFNPDGRQISIHAGATLVEAAGQVGIILNTVCGGGGTCRKCVVEIGPSAEEVLACQYQVQSDIVVTIPPASRFFEQKILAVGIDANPRFSPDIYKKYVKVSGGGKIFGVAVDLGTTTVVAKLIDMIDGRCLATEAAVNPQTRFGDDVISRIAYAESEAKLGELHEAAVGCINELVVKLCEGASIDRDSIFEISVVGNTTMNHIFLRYPLKSLGQAPYDAYSLAAADIGAGEIGVEMNAAGSVHTAANISGFVGSDTTAVALAVDIDSSQEETLVVDIGTNGELVLAVGGELYAASCAAGPAFEGARINCGSRAVDGAIEAVVVNEYDIDLDVIGGCAARSICGSGLIDAVAVLLNLGILEATGRFADAGELSGNLPDAILSRIIEVDGQPAFCLADSGERGGGKVVLTQRDIRQVQLAKGAIRTGIKLLQQKVGLADADIKHILLAGAFGNYIRKESALRIGLLPEVELERIRFVGNAASSGAEMILLSSQWRQLAEQLAERIEYVEIANEPDFNNVYAESMMF